MADIDDWITNSPAPRTGEKIEVFIPAYVVSRDKDPVIAWDKKHNGWFDDKNHRYAEPEMWRRVKTPL
jgi:hypothetical protein